MQPRQIAITLAAVLVAFVAAFGVAKAAGGGGEKKDTAGAAGEPTKRIDVPSAAVNATFVTSGSLPALKSVRKPKPEKPDDGGSAPPPPPPPAGTPPPAAPPPPAGRESAPGRSPARGSPARGASSTSASARRRRWRRRRWRRLRRGLSRHRILQPARSEGRTSAGWGGGAAGPLATPPSRRFPRLRNARDVAACLASGQPPSRPRASPRRVWYL